MELNQVRYFLAVCEARNFTRAAERCNVSQPALTAGIKRLEQELEGPLFHRDRSGAKLTPLGQVLLPRFQALAAERASIVELAHQHRRLKGVPLRVGVLVTIGPSRIAGVLETFRASAPAVELELHVDRHDALLAKLEQADLEVVITNLVASPPEWLVIKKLYEEPICVLLPPGHALSGRAGIELSELSGQPYIDRMACELRDAMLQEAACRNVELYASYRTEREAWIECLVRAGVGFAFMPEHSVISNDTIKRPLIDPEVSRKISILRSADHSMSPVTRLFWDTLVQTSEQRR